jgi:hypothetical protein
VRNLLEEFDAQPPGEARPVTIVGFPEHIFTQSSGFVTAIYMAVQARHSTPTRHLLDIDVAHVPYVLRPYATLY